MLTFVRTAQAMPGKLPEFIAVAKEVAAIWKRLSGRDLAVANAFGGNGTEVAWITQSDSAGQLEEAMGRILVDPDYRAAIRKFETLLVPGSVRDQMWRHV